jgi:aarF domain-containing kinase
MRFLAGILFVCLLLSARATAFLPFVPHKHSSLACAPIRAFSASSSSNNNNSDNNNNGSTKRRKPKTVADRTPQEVADLLRDILQATADAGVQAGPRRTFQAYQALTQTARDFLPRLGTEVSLPAVLRTLFERMGATYVKLGQFIASSPTLFPKEYVVEFQKCLDQTEPLPWLTVKRVIEQELGPISRTFASVNQTPLASASIAQVHTATLLDTGEQVVIKIQKPGIDASLKADLGFLFVAARVLEFLQPDWERTSLAAVVGDIRASMLEELDFEKEARNTIEFRRFLQDNNLLGQATAPRVYQNYSTKKVMVLEKLDGVSMLDEAAIASVARDSKQSQEIIITALNIWSLSVTAMPWFHADVHAGNLLLLKDGRVGFIDFGIVGRISPKVFQSVTELSTALALGDSEAMAIALCNMGAASEDVDTKKFGRDIERVLKRMGAVQTQVTVGVDADGRLEGGRIDIIDDGEITDMLLELVEVTENNGLKLPREFGLLVKQSLYFDRYLKILAPSIDVMSDERIKLGGKLRDEQSPVNGDRVIIEV